MNEQLKSELKTTEDYNPITCDHRKPNGLSAYDLLSHGSGSGKDFGFEENISVCLRCGTIKVTGKNLVDKQWQYFSKEFSIDLPDAVAAIVKNCNYMNSDTVGYKPFSAQETKPLQERIDELEGALKGMYTEDEVKKIIRNVLSDASYSAKAECDYHRGRYTGLAEVNKESITSINPSDYLKPQQ